MHLPIELPQAMRASNSARVYARDADKGALAPQGCNPIKKIACAGAVAACIATPNPVACILAIAPHCAECL